MRLIWFRSFFNTGLQISLYSFRRAGVFPVFLLVLGVLEAPFLRFRNVARTPGAQKIVVLGWVSVLTVNTSTPPLFCLARVLLVLGGFGGTFSLIKKCGRRARDAYDRSSDLNFLICDQCLRPCSLVTSRSSAGFGSFDDTSSLL